MPNQNSIPKNYDAGDLVDAYHVSEADLNWSFTAINTLSKKITELKKNLEKSYKVPDCYFSELETLAGMFEYLIEERGSYHSGELEKYSKEWEQLKGGAE